MPERARGRVGAELTVTARRLVHAEKGWVAAGRRHVRRHLQAASPQTPGVLSPSIVDVPEEGCWRIDLRTGTITARTAVVARPY